MVWWQIVLFPFAILYDVITRLRNHLFTIGYSRSFQFDANVINVGNLAVGGTGKSPFVVYLLQYFHQKNQSTATLSRGYGRKTKGFFILSDQDTPKSAGDEPIVLYRRFGDRSLISVGEERALAIPTLLHEKPDLDVIILDDAFQHRTVTPSFNILLTTFQRPFYNDYIMPSGLLREGRKGAARSDVIIVSKCPPTLHEAQMEQMKEKIRKYAPGSEVFFTGLKYGEPQPLFEKKEKKDRALIVSGIANPELFFDYSESHFEVVDKRTYGDHHFYSDKEVSQLIALLNKYNAMLITTEKDAVKLREFDMLSEYPCFILPIEVYFLEKEDRFLEMLEGSIKSYERKS